MIATTSDSLPHTNGNSTIGLWFPSRWSPEWGTRGTKIRTCSTSDSTKSNLKWRIVEWKCIRMAVHRPLWCRVLVVCIRIGRVFDVEFDWFELDAPRPLEWVCDRHVNESVGFKFWQIQLTRFRKPKYAPTNVSGTETPNHNANNATNVLNGTAPELPLLHSTKFITKNNPKTTLKISIFTFREFSLPDRR